MSQAQLHHNVHVLTLASRVDLSASHSAAIFTWCYPVLAVDQVHLHFVHLLEEGGDLESVGLLALHCHLPPGPTSLNHTPARLSQESASNKRMICVIII